MRQPVPVDLMRVAPRVYGDLDLPQTLSLGLAGLLAIAALTGRLPIWLAALLAAPAAAYALLEVDEQPLRRLVPHLVRFALRQIEAREALSDDALWYRSDSPPPERGRGRL